MLAPYLKQSHITAEEDRLVIVADSDFVRGFIARESQMKEITDAIQGLIGKEVRVEVRTVPTGATFDEAYDNLEDVVKMDVAIED